MAANPWRGGSIDFTGNPRALVLAELALANRDPDKIATVIIGLSELLGAALVVSYRDDRQALDLACTALEGVIHQSAVKQLETLRALGVLDEDGQERRG